MTPSAVKRLGRRGDSEDATRVETDEVIQPTEENSESDAPDGGEATPVRQDADEHSDHGSRRTGIRWQRILIYGILPSLALIMSIGAGYLKWYDSSFREARIAADESVRAASDGAVAMLSYRPDSVDKDLGAARDRLSGALKDSYSSLIRDVVIPGSKQKVISAAASVPAAASVSASPNHAVVLMFINQTITVGNDPPTNTASRVRATLDKLNGRWLISSFDPI